MRTLPGYKPWAERTKWERKGRDEPVLWLAPSMWARWQAAGIDMGPYEITRPIPVPAPIPMRVKGDA